VTDDQWKDMDIPVGLVNEIKDKIAPQKKPADTIKQNINNPNMIEEKKTWISSTNPESK